jgi:integrase
VKLSRYWYILYRVAGRRIRESSESESKMVAEKLLQRRLGEHGLGIRPAQDTKNVRYKEIRDAYLEEARNKGRTFFVRADGEEYINGMKHLDDFFMGARATDISSDMIRRFIEARRKEGAADPTIRRNLVILRSMLNLARKEGKLRHVDLPYFSMPKDSEPAGQYVPPEDFAKLLKVLPVNLHPFFIFMYATGCRLGAAQRITWDMVSSDCTEIKLPAAIMKARQPLTLVLAGPVLEPVAATLRKMFRTEGPVFNSTNYRPAWSKACAKVGLGTYDKKTRTRTGVRIHDCRCSAAVNLVDAGVNEDLVMKIGGWKTKAMFSRYNVINTMRTREAMIQGGQYVAARAKQA